jgi:DNA-binding PadR family transcriptional regulator
VLKKTAARNRMDAMALELARAGLVEVLIEEGRVRYRTTPEGERLRRLLVTADRAEAQAVLDALLDTGEAATRHDS